MTWMSGVFCPTGHEMSLSRCFFGGCKGICSSFFTKMITFISRFEIGKIYIRSLEAVWFFEMLG